MEQKQSLVEKLDVYAVVIFVLLAIIFIQRCSHTEIKPVPPRIDTIVSYVHLHDTIIIKKPKLIKSEPDTLWKDSIIYIPDTTYPALLLQYKKLGNKYYTSNMYNTVFPIGSYGNVTITDIVKGNQLISTHLISNLNIPEKTVTIIKQAPPKRQVYLGLGVFGSKRALIDGVYVGALYKDKKDRIFGYNIGYNNAIQIGLSSYWKFKF